jgi:predicted ATPase
MRIVNITVKQKPPIEHFEISDLSNIVVLAGPNGIGKTRLVQAVINLFQSPVQDPRLFVKIEATSQDEITKWRKSYLSTTDANDLNILRNHLQKNRRRGKWTSSIVNLDSFRTFEAIQSFQWSWDFRDPFEEEIGWNFMFNPFKNRYQDTIQALYKKVGHYTTDISKRYEELRKAGEKQMPIDPTDPLKKFKDAFHLLLSPKELADIPLSTPQIQYTENGKLLPIESLSSGEREVFTTVFDLLLHEPNDCIIFFDEPEMHLHPELSFRLLRTLESIGGGNQFIFCTHSPDIITQSLNHSVVFIKPKDADKNQAVCVMKDDEKAIALNLLGQNLGVIALGRKIVLIEGRESSLDKQIYGEIVGSLYPQFVLVPTGPRQTILSFSQIVGDVLSKALWGIDFFMISDHDSSLPEEAMKDLSVKSSGRLAFLPRYHLENYFLDENVISRMFQKMEPDESWLRNSDQIKDKLKQLARDSIPYSIQLWIGAFLRSKVGEVEVSISGVDKMNLTDYVTKLQGPILTEQKRINSALSVDEIKDLVSKRWDLLTKLIDDDNDDWKKIIPGRVICHKFSNLAKLDPGRFKNMYINQVKEDGLAPFQDIIRIFESFGESKT